MNNYIARYSDIFSRARDISFHSNDEDLIGGQSIPISSSSSGGGRVFSHEDGIFVPDLDTIYTEKSNATLEPTKIIFGFLKQLDKKKSVSWDTRAILVRAVEKFENSILKPKAILVAPELEFYLFQKSEAITTPTFQYSELCPVSTFMELNDKAHQNLSEASDMQMREWLLSPLPFDGTAVFRQTLAKACKEACIPVLRHLTEGGPGQIEFNFEPQAPINAADTVLKFKTLAHQVARQMNLQVSFMPKPYAKKPTNGMHWNFSFGGNRPLFKSTINGDVSEHILGFIGGLFHHMKSLNAICNPSTNSYKRLLTRFNRTHPLAFTHGNRTGTVRIPWVSEPKQARMEIRFPDAMANPYLTIAALLMAGMDGIEHNLNNEAKLSEQELDMGSRGVDIRERPNPDFAMDLNEAILALFEDQDYLISDGVFPNSILESYIQVLGQQQRLCAATPSPIETNWYFNR